jgi:N6-L-threonylcarbamoyladenine synthase
MKVLGIESTCDETAASIVEDGKKILSNVVLSQASLHANYGGVFPEIASRAHIEAIIPVIKQALDAANLKKEDIDLIAVAKAPGLVGGLLIGIEAAKGLSLALDKPFIGVNHVEAHLYAAMMEEEKPLFPSLGVVLSGGHTLLVQINAIGSYDILGTTIDDALGEAFDKLAVMLGFSYPGGPMVEKIAKAGDRKAYPLSSGKIKDKPFDFSFSGIKTACRTLIEKQPMLTEKIKQDIAASFQEAVFSDLAKKLIKLTEAKGIYNIYLGGGVVCNKMMRDYLQSKLPQVRFVFAPKDLCVDNAAMIAGLGFHRFFLSSGSDDLTLMPQTRTPKF